MESHLRSIQFDSAIKQDESLTERILYILHMQALTPHSPMKLFHSVSRSA